MREREGRLTLASGLKARLPNVRDQVEKPFFPKTFPPAPCLSTHGGWGERGDRPTKNLRAKERWFARNDDVREAAVGSPDRHEAVIEPFGRWRDCLPATSVFAASPLSSLSKKRVEWSKTAIGLFRKGKRLHAQAPNKLSGTDLSRGNIFSVCIPIQSIGGRH